MTGELLSDEGDEAPIRNDDVLRIVLVGRTGAGKSATGNTILGHTAFKSEPASSSVTDRCKEASGLVASKNISIVDTPGLFDDRFSKDEIIEKFSDCIPLAAPGPHAFLLVVDIASRFTKEEQRSVEIIQKVFGQKSDEYTMVLFTNSDRLKGKPVEDILSGCSKLQELVSKCKGGYHVFNNETGIQSQVNELMSKVSRMVADNGGSHYTNEMFQKAAKERKREKLLRDVKKAVGVGMPAAGSAIGVGVGAGVFEGALVAGVAGGGIGIAVGGVAALIVVGGIALYKHFKEKKKNKGKRGEKREKEEKRRRNNTEEYRPLTKEMEEDEDERVDE